MTVSPCTVEYCITYDSITPLMATISQAKPYKLPVLAAHHTSNWAGWTTDIRSILVRNILVRNILVRNIFVRNIFVRNIGIKNVVFEISLLEIFLFEMFFLEI